MASESRSPFIEGTQVQYAWDNTSLTWLMDCPRKYYYSMIEGWQPKSISVHLTFGLEYHWALEQYDILRFVHKMDHDHALFAVVQSVMERTYGFASEHKTKNRPNLLRSIIWYLEHFRDDVAQTIVLSSGKPAVELSFRIPLGDVSLGGVQVLWGGHLDRVVSLLGSTYVMDRKTTTASLGDYYFAGYDLDRQMTGYTYMGQIALQSPIAGVIIDAAQIAVGGTNFARGFTYRSAGRMEEWIDQTAFWIGTAQRHAKHDSWPMNETSCNNYRSNDPTADSHGCVFKEICKRDPSQRERFLNTHFERRRWNPLETR